jgi:hypothetical protein
MALNTDTVECVVSASCISLFMLIKRTSDAGKHAAVGSAIVAHLHLVADLLDVTAKTLVACIHLQGIAVKLRILGLGILFGAVRHT